MYVGIAGLGWATDAPMAQRMDVDGCRRYWRLSHDHYYRFCNAESNVPRLSGMRRCLRTAPRRNDLGDLRNYWSRFVCVGVDLGNCGVVATEIRAEILVRYESRT